MPVHQSSGHEHGGGRSTRPVSGNSQRSSLKTKTASNSNTAVRTGAPSRRVTNSGRPIATATKTRKEKSRLGNTQDGTEIKAKKQENGEHENEMRQNQNDIKDYEKITNGDFEKRADDEKSESDTGNTRFQPSSSEEPLEKAPPPKTPSPPPPPPEPQPEVFTIDKFNNTMDSFADVFSSHKFTNVNDDYPVDELVSVVSDVTESIEEFKQQTVSSQRHLEDLRQKMRDVKERIQTNVQRKSSVIRVNDETQTIEERELNEKLSRLNAQVAQANAELAEALRLSAETESTAVEAQLAAEKAKEEAKNIQEEVAFRAKVEERRREQDKKKQEEERRKMEEVEAREEEIRREKEAEWKRKEHGSDKPPAWDNWPVFEYKLRNQSIELGCIIRGHPTKFNQNDIICSAMDQIDFPVPFNENEELVSVIINLESSVQDNTDRLEDPIVVCIPFKATRALHGHHTAKEPVVKIEHNGHWVCLETKEESIDTYKEYKFAVCEVKTLSRMAVFYRLKRDYATVSNRGGKMTSSYDQRISMTLPKDCIDGRDHILMEVQPVDSSSVNDLRHRKPTCKGLLTSSPIVHMEWESTDFKKPVTVTVPCPPNPIKAKKLAAMRKEKEEKMKHPPKIHLILPHEVEAMEKEKAKSKLQKMQEQIAEEENKVEEPKPTKWYMGEYANMEDDENDNLFLVSSQGNNKWTPVENVNIMQVKLDLLQFDLDKPLDRFMVLRTRTNVVEDTIGPMASEVSSFLSQKFVQVILKQKSDDPFDTVLSVVPSSKTEKTIKKLSEEGYDDGPEPSQVLSINEGDNIEVGFRGNVKNKDHEEIKFVYNSNLESETEFYACEVDKYLQKNFPVFRGVVEVYRKYTVKTVTKRKRRDSSSDNEEPPSDIKREKMCELSINIPKYHVEQNSTVIKAPITIKNTTDPVNENLMRYVAEELGDEWRTVASHLCVSKARLQAILKNIQNGDQTECDARYDMLMTWLKKTPKATDKIACLGSALLKSGRGDIAEDIRSKDRDYREQHRAH